MDDRVAVITGASRGIGAAAAKAFAADGYRVALLARSLDATRAVAEEIGADRAMGLHCDVADFASVEAALAEVDRLWRRLDVLVGNAGVIEPIARMEDVDLSHWGRAIDVNLKGVMHGMRAALPRMLAGGGGTVITVSSGAAHGPVEGWSHYCAAKAGAAMLTRCLDKEHRDNGIRAMGLSPGTVATDMQREIKASGINPVSRLDWSDHIPPEWPARTLVWMAGPAGDRFLGEEVSLRDEGVRREAGLAP